jgi:hypothetical protein
MRLSVSYHHCYLSKRQVASCQHAGFRGMGEIVQISVRSYLTLGTATVVGAGAIAMTPALPGSAAHAAYLPAPAVAEVSLTGLSFSLTDIVGLLGNLDLGGLLPDLGGLSPDLAKAVLVEFIKEAKPVVQATAGDVFQYVSGAVTGLVIGPDSIPVRFGSAIAEIPAVVKTALGDLKDRDIAAALKTLNEGLVAPIKSISEVLLQTADGIRTYVSTQVATLAEAIPGILMSAIAAVIGNNGQGLLEAIKDAVAGLIGGLLPGAVTPAGSKLAVFAEGDVVSDTPAVSDTESVSDTEPVGDTEPVSDTDTAPAAAAVAPKVGAARAAASVRAAAPAAAAESAIEAEPVAETPESAAPEAVTDEAAAPVTRSRAAAHRAAVADEVANGPAVTARPKPSQRADRQNTERPRAAAASRAG